ncbi:hypothetical protein BKA62DRAFT_72970 [Auriculariales sp. MPI-PUGE-AT-0066]|nr:hypothetical protein BKA62DRAFT_72970 [Auriculariales sp. MPI-PUGE-AT-0066]
MLPNDRANNAELAALRRKKNADAQAAFRKRRASYITSLESTVHGLEQVIRNLQESVQECKLNEANVRRENQHLKYELENSLRKVNQGQPSPRSADAAGHGQQWSSAYRTAQGPYQPPIPASPSFTPPLSSANGSPSPPSSSVISSASAAVAPTSPYIRTSGGSGAGNGYIDEHPVNLLSRPLNMYRDPKGQPIGVENGVYTFQNGPQDTGGWVDSPVQTHQQSSAVNSFAYQHHQTDSPQSAHSSRQMPFNLNTAVDTSRTAYSSASASPTTTDSGSPYMTRGPPVQSFAPAPSSAHGMDPSAAFRSYFSHATSSNDPSASSLNGSGLSHLRGTDPAQIGSSSSSSSVSHMGPPPPLVPPPLSQRPDMPPPIVASGLSRGGGGGGIGGDDDDEGDYLDDDDRAVSGDDPIVSQTLAVLKSHAFGGSRKPRVRSIRGVQRHDSNGRSALSPGRD